MLPKHRTFASVVLMAAMLGPIYGQRFGGFFMRQNEPPADSEFVFARWQYSTGSGGWSHDYPDAEEHINQIMKEATGIHLEQEVRNFREYVDRGGFVMLDDFDGPRQFAIMQQNMERVFPDREMVRLDDTHNVLRTFYNINSIYVESPYDVGGRAVFYGINNDQGHLSVIICFNNDIGDFWEWIDQPQYALKASAEALKLGINFVLYSMTH